MAVQEGLDFLQRVLQLLEYVVWGEVAMGDLGVLLVVNSFMLVPSDHDMSISKNLLEKAGFRRAPWSYGSPDSKVLEAQNDPQLLRTHDNIKKEYNMLDSHSTRFLFPPDMETLENMKVVFLHSDYVELSPPPQTSQPVTGFKKDGIFYYPDKVVLLESVIRTLLKEEKFTIWKELLNGWAFSYIYGFLDVPLDALDGCSSDEVKDWFNKGSRRDRGGLDRNITKRTGGLPPKTTTDD